LGGVGNGNICRHVSVVRLDDILCTRFSGKKLFVKIDVEGGEYQVLEGMYSLLKNQKPLLLIEIWRGQFDPRGINPCYRQTFEMLFSLGYTIMTIDERLKIDDAILDKPEIGLGYNFLAIPG